MRNLILKFIIIFIFIVPILNISKAFSAETYDNFLIYHPMIFSAPYYLYVNADLRNAFGNDADGGLERAKTHWKNSGIREHRVAHPDFQIDQYFEAHPLVKSEGISRFAGDVKMQNFHAIYHYIKGGISGGWSLSLASKAPSSTTISHFETTTILTKGMGKANTATGTTRVAFPRLGNTNIPEITNSTNISSMKTALPFTNADHLWGVGNLSGTSIWDIAGLNVLRSPTEIGFLMNTARSPLVTDSGSANEYSQTKLLPFTISEDLGITPYNNAALYPWAMLSSSVPNAKKGLRISFSQKITKAERANNNVNIQTGTCLLIFEMNTARSGIIQVNNVNRWFWYCIDPYDVRGNAVAFGEDGDKASYDVATAKPMILMRTGISNRYSTQCAGDYKIDDQTTDSNYHTNCTMITSANLYFTIRELNRQITDSQSSVPLYSTNLANYRLAGWNLGGEIVIPSPSTPSNSWAKFGIIFKDYKLEKISYP